MLACSQHLAWTDVAMLTVLLVFIMFVIALASGIKGR